MLMLYADGSQCYCGDAISNGSAKVAETDCSMPCGGLATEACGAGDRLNMYSVTSFTVNQNPGPTGSKLLGCYSEPSSGRALSQSYSWPNMTASVCVDACNRGKFSFAGIEVCFQVQRI